MCMCVCMYIMHRYTWRRRALPYVILYLAWGISHAGSDWAGSGPVRKISESWHNDSADVLHDAADGNGAGQLAAEEAASRRQHLRVQMTRVCYVTRVRCVRFICYIIVYDVIVSYVMLYRSIVYKTADRCLWKSRSRREGDPWPAAGSRGEGPRERSAFFGDAGNNNHNNNNNNNKS